MIKIGDIRKWFSSLGQFPVVRGRRDISTKYKTDIFFSIVLTVFALPILLPLVIVVAIAIKLDSKGSILFSQLRVGQWGTPFYIYKFRSMCMDAEKQRNKLEHLNEACGPIFKIRDDPRITSVGRILRRFSIDELPQLINVFQGQMSLVGPRPPLPSEVSFYDDYQLRRLTVKPGMVGLPQVSGRSDLTFDEIVLLDLYYIENWSWKLDMKILLKTILTVINGKGAY